VSEEEQEPLAYDLKDQRICLATAIAAKLSWRFS
jgi:hypothetical protein